MAEYVFTKENFVEEVEKSSIPVVIDFWASWCGPCKMMSPLVDRLAKELEGKVKVGKINVDEQPELAERFGVMSIPTFIRFNNGKLESAIVGGRSYEPLLEFAMGSSN